MLRIVIVAAIFATAHARPPAYNGRIVGDEDTAAENDLTQIPRLQLDMTPFKKANLPVVWVLGGPGSGKGTQCQKIVEKFGFIHISTGDLLRAEVESGSELGKKCQAIMKAGALVPSGIVVDLVKKAILETVSTAKGYLIDGMPREVAQARMFEEEIAPCTAVLSLEVPDSVLRDRLLARGKESGRIDDQTVETINKRIEKYHEISEAVTKEYDQKCIKIDGNRPIDVVFADVENVVSAVTYNPKTHFSPSNAS